MLCDKIVKESHIEIENVGQKKDNKNICGTKMCMSCQTSFGLNYKHHWVIHNYSNKLPVKRTLFTDSDYQSYISIFLSKSIEDKDKIFWRDPDDTSTQYK